MCSMGSRMVHNRNALKTAKTMLVVILCQLIIPAIPTEILANDAQHVSNGGSHEVSYQLETDADETRMSYKIVTCDNHTSTLTSVRNHATNLDIVDFGRDSRTTSEFRIGISNHRGNKLVLETESQNSFTFTYSLDCNQLYRNISLVLSVPRTKILTLQEKNNNIVNCASMPSRNMSVKNSLNLTKVHFNESQILCRGTINETLIAGLIGITHIDFKLYSSNRMLRSTTARQNKTAYGLQNNRPITNKSGDISYRHNFGGMHTQLVYSENRSDAHLESTSIEVLVIRSPKMIDTVFIGLVFAMEIVQMITMGSMLEVDDFKKSLKQPLPLVTQLVCQYLITTMISYAVAKILEPDDRLAAAGTFTIGICPGGSASHIYAYLLYGDLALSITMTVLGYLVAFGTTPLWVYTIGQEFLTGYDVTIPYTDLFLTLATVIPPLILGLLIRKHFQSITDQLQNILTPVIILLAVGFLATGIYANLYVFYLLDVRLTIIGCAMSFFGYILGAIILLPIRRSKKLAVTMSIESGMKNTGIGYSLLVQSMPPPLGDIASVVTLSAEIASQIPPLIVSTAVLLKELFDKKYKPVKQDVNGTEADQCDTKTEL